MKDRKKAEANAEMRMQMIAPLLSPDLDHASMSALKQRFQRAHRHDLWQGDIKYGPNLMLNGFPTQTYLSCLIDDATRYVVHAEFYADMEQTIVEDTL